MIDENTYNMQLMLYLGKNKHDTEYDYLKYEIERHKEIIQYHVGKSKSDIRRECIIDYKKINPSRQIDEELLNFNIRNKIDDSKNIISRSKSHIKFYQIKLNRFGPVITEPSIDFSDNNEKEKVIFLVQLGILDFLKKETPFIHSTNLLATAISGFTGIKKSTLQSYINPIISSDSSQKNNPLTNENSVKKVRNKLTDLGYTPSK